MKRIFTISNPCAAGERKPVALITDRAKRLRANACPPPGPRQCHYCGSRQNIDVEHVNGNEADGAPDNLSYACRSCNTRKGAHFARVGFGRRTKQYNPAGKAKGAKNLAQWMKAVMSAKGEASDMSVPDAVAMIRATPHEDRSGFAGEIWQRRRARQQL